MASRSAARQQRRRGGVAQQRNAHRRRRRAAQRLIGKERVAGAARAACPGGRQHALPGDRDRVAVGARRRTRDAAACRQHRTDAGAAAPLGAAADQVAPFAQVERGAGEAAAVGERACTDQAARHVLAGMGTVGVDAVGHVLDQHERLAALESFEFRRGRARLHAGEAEHAEGADQDGDEHLDQECAALRRGGGPRTRSSRAHAQAPLTARARPDGRSCTQRLLAWLLIVMRTVAVGEETRPLKSKVIVAGAPVIVTDCAAGLRVLSASPSLTETTDQPCAQPAPPRAIVTLALRLSASLRASMRSPVRSYDSPLACWAARNSPNDGAMTPMMTTRIDTTVRSSTMVKPRARARNEEIESARARMAHQQVPRAAVLAPVWSIASVPQRSETWSVVAFGVAVRRKVGGGPATAATARSYEAATFAGTAMPTVVRLAA